MGIVDIKEHTTCVNYEDVNAEKKNRKPIVEFIKILKGNFREDFLSEAEIILVLKGCFSISYEGVENQIITDGKLMLLPSGCLYRLEVEKEDVSVIILRLQNKIEFCDRVGIEQLYNKVNKVDDNLNLLDINYALEVYIRGLQLFISDGLKCFYYLELKIREFFYILRAYYTKEELARFFYPVLTVDQNFSDFVYSNYYKVKTVQDLVALSNFSHSGFVKRFKKNFGMPAYQWMKQQKATRILHEINCSDKAIKQISDEYDFSSLSQFNDFCKSNFGYPPSKIRKNKCF